MDEITRDVTSDVTWMTYAELGRVRGIDAASAKRLAIRRHWRRQAGNDGTARVAVPVTEATPRKAKPSDDAGDDTRDVTSDVTRVINALDSAVVTLREQLAHAENRADQAEVRAEQAQSRADRAEQAIESERNRADRAESGFNAERSRADALRDRVDGLQVELRHTQEAAKQAGAQAQEAQDAADELRRAEATRKARGLVARLRDAWRGE
jgi:hypothetical protein